MVEVLWVTLFGAAFAWLQLRSEADDTVGAAITVDDEWTRWEEEIHDWRDQF